MPANFSSTGNITLGGYHKYGNFTLNAGHTLFVGSSSYQYYGYKPLPNDPTKYCVIIHCTGTCRIHGKIDAFARGPFGFDYEVLHCGHKDRGIPGYSADGVLGGAGGLFRYSRIRGQVDYIHRPSSLSSPSIVDLKSAGIRMPSRLNRILVRSGLCPQSGAVSESMSADYATAMNYLMSKKREWPFYVYGGGGSGGTYNDVRNPVRGGGGVWIQARRIIFDGEIDARGAPGSLHNWIGPWHNGNDCYAGGGGGGVVVMIAEQIFDSGVTRVDGGGRGYGCATYSDPGGNGVKLVVTVPSKGVFHGMVF